MFVVDLSDFSWRPFQITGFFAEFIGKTLILMEGEGPQVWKIAPGKIPIA